MKKVIMLLVVGMLSFNAHAAIKCFLLGQVGCPKHRLLRCQVILVLVTVGLLMALHKPTSYNVMQVGLNLSFVHTQ